MISVEKHVVAVAHDSNTLMTGLAALIAIYFVLNLKYQPDAEATLEFIQRSAVFYIYSLTHNRLVCELAICKIFWHK